LAESIARKESALASLRETELRQKRGSLAEVGPIMGWVADVVMFLRDRVRAWPALLGVEHGRGAEQLAEREVKRLLKDVEKHWRARARYHGIGLPPPLPPPPPPSRLPSYEQYVAGSVDGEREPIPPGERLGSLEWRALHPAVSDQQMFELMKRKRAWDADMAALLARRHAWDIPSGATAPDADPHPHPDGGES
jgi:hypothetical protein